MNQNSEAVYQRLITLNSDAAALHQKHNANPQLWELKEDELNAVIKHIAKTICVLTGLVILPADATGILRMMKKAIVQHYPKFTHEEILYAFELNSMGKLPDGVVSHYNRFNIDYIGAVMRSFIEYRKALAPVIVQMIDQYDYQKQLAASSSKPLLIDTNADQKFIDDRLAEFEATGNVILSDVVYDTLVQSGTFEADHFAQFEQQGIEFMQANYQGKQQRRQRWKPQPIGEAIGNLKIRKDDSDVDFWARKVAVFQHFLNIINSRTQQSSKENLPDKK